MEINIRLKVKKEEKGRKHINYDIEELRENPQKLGMAETEQQRKQLIKKLTEGETESQRQRGGKERGRQIWYTLAQALTEHKNKNSSEKKEKGRERNRQNRRGNTERIRTNDKKSKNTKENKERNSKYNRPL